MSSRARLSLCFLGGIFLLAAPLMGNAALTKEISSTLKSCQAKCKPENDAKAYEGCMLKCGQAEKAINDRSKAK